MPIWFAWLLVPLLMVECMALLVAGTRDLALEDETDDFERNG